MSAQSTPLKIQPDLNPLAAMAYRSVSEDGICLFLLSDPPGVTEVPGLRNTRVSIHVGPSVQVACRRGGSYHRGRAVHGDIDIIPAGMPSLWEVNATDTFFTLSITPELLSMVAEEFDCDPGRIEIRNRFQVRDPQLENLGWALKAEMECGYPCGRLYLDSLAIAVAARLVRCHSSLAREPKKIPGRLSDRRLRRALDYIEANLGQNIALADIAAVVGLSVSHFKILFREAVGLPAHQYLIRRRVERAKSLLSEGKLSISQIAMETGFAHQSHLARHMRRVLGVSPKALREMIR
ncbi:MAG TPA: AraC family transcriptional regulator [Blastocatellia bacterium]|nr:AraC family transcriptional regulator [Blastocatellia bacterium]